MLTNSNLKNTPKRGSSAAAGSVTDEQFRLSFENVPVIKFHSLKELIAECQKQSLILEDVNNDWNKRVKALQTIRGLLKSGANDYPEFVNQCYTLLGSALQLSVKDLRSQVCREACITIAYFCEKLGTLFWRVTEILIPTTMSLVQNSAKVMASSAKNVNHYIAKYVRNSKILQLLMSFHTSKSKDIRRCTISLITDIITNWEASALEKNWPELMQALKAGIYDADVEARAFARQAYEALQSTYPQRAEFLFNELDAAKQRTLVGRSSTASSTHSINSERDNLQASNRGLYSTQQNAFLSKRSTSDLNHSIHLIQKLNLGTRQVHKPNVIRSAKPPQISANLPKPIDTPVSSSKKPLSSLHKNSSNLLTSVNEKSHKSISQPGSRNTSPNRFRPPRAYVSSQASERKTQNGNFYATPNSVYTRNYLNGASTINSNPISLQRSVSRALRNVDMQARDIRPNIVRHDEDQGFAFSPSTGFVNRNVVSTSRLSNNSNTETFNNSSGNSLNSQRIFPGDMFDELNNKYSNSLRNNTQAQEVYVNEICKLLQTSNEESINEKEIELELYLLSHKIRDNSLTQWDDFFGPIFLALIYTISHYNSNSIKLNALKALKDLCQSQPQRLVQKLELAMLNVLNAHNCEDATVVRVAEDCAATLAMNLPVDVCLKLLITVIDDENTAYHQLSGAIKMLSRVVEKISMEEVKKILSTIVPRMTKCYENSQSMVRRASIICLVAISNSIGIDELKPHLNTSTLKLVEVYRNRMAKTK